MHCLEQLPLGEPVREWGRRSELPGELRQQPAQCRSHLRLRPQYRLAGRISLRRSERVDDRQVGQAEVADLHARSGQREPAGLGDQRGDLFQQPGFSRARIAAQQRERRPVAGGDGLDQLREFALATDEGASRRTGHPPIVAQPAVRRPPSCDGDSVGRGQRRATAGRPCGSGHDADLRSGPLLRTSSSS